MQRIIGLLAVLLFLTFVSPCIGDTDSETVAVFKNDETEVSYEEGGKESIQKSKPRAFRVPAFVGGVIKGKEFLAVLCEARYNGSSKWSFIDGAARTSYGDYKTWSDAKIFAKHTRTSKRYSVVGDVTAVMKEEKIYALATSFDDATFTWSRHGSNTRWDPLMFVGTFTAPKESNTGGLSVTWEKGKSLKTLLPQTVLNKTGFQFIGGVGNGVVTKNGTIVIPVQVSNTKNEYTASIIYSTGESSTWNIGAMTKSGVTEGSVVEWGDNKLILFVRYDKGYRRAYESDDMGATWKSSLMFSRVWGNRPERTGIGSQGSAITAPVDDKNVLLFAHPLNNKGDFSRDTLQLWMSDGKRILCVGTISKDGKGEKTGYSILAHVADHLYIVHEVNPPGYFMNYQYQLKKLEGVIAISPLPQLFETVKSTVRTWRKLDIDLKTINIPTDGLVGFLGDGNNEAVWADWYNCVNATVDGATRVTGGFRFNGTVGSGAQWPVRSQGQNQVYRFTKKQFTIAATVKIQATSDNEDISLLGAIEDAEGDNVLLGIGYTKEKKWYAVHSKDVKISTEVSSVELDKEYHIAITFANGVCSVYVDGVALINGKLMTPSTASISHFYMGGLGKYSTAKGISGTVKNVMLFNRNLSQTEISGLSTVVKEDKLKNVKLTDIHKSVAESSSPGSAVAQTISDSGNGKSHSMTKPAIVKEDDRRSSVGEPKDTSAAGMQRFSEGNGIRNGQRDAVTGAATYLKNHSGQTVFRVANTKHSLQDYHEGDFQHKDKSTDGAVMPLPFVPWFFFVCSAIVLL